MWRRKKWGGENGPNMFFINKIQKKTNVEEAEKLRMIILLRQGLKKK